MSKSGREEKKVAAHEGAVVSLRWNHDGSALVTAGEDGAVKVWSRSGMHRSTLIKAGTSVYSVCWAPDNDAMVFSQGSDLIIKALQVTFHFPLMCDVTQCIGAGWEEAVEVACS